MPVRQFPRPLGQKLALLRVELILAFDENVVNFEARKIVFEQHGLDFGGIVIGPNEHQPPAVRVRLDFIGHKTIGSGAVKFAHGKTEEQSVCQNRVTHPLPHAREHRVVAHLRHGGLDIDMPQIIPMRVGIEGVWRDEAAELLLEQPEVGRRDFKSRGIREVA